MRTIELTDGGILLYDDAFLPADVADQYFAVLRDDCAWEQKPGVFGHMQPRLTASYGDEGVTYRYSGTVNVALPWTPTLLEIKTKVEAVEGRYNYCLLNRYRSGQDSMGKRRERGMVRIDRERVTDVWLGRLNPNRLFPPDSRFFGHSQATDFDCNQSAGFDLAIDRSTRHFVMRGEFGGRPPCSH